MKIVKNETVEDLKESKELVFVDGWAYIGQKHTHSNPDTMICYYPENDTNNLLVGVKNELNALKYLTIYVPYQFVETHKDKLSSLKEVLLALVEEDVEYFSALPTNLYEDSAFMKDYTKTTLSAMHKQIKDLEEAKSRKAFVENVLAEKVRAINAYKAEVARNKKELQKKRKQEKASQKKIDAVINSTSINFKRK